MAEIRPIIDEMTEMRKRLASKLEIPLDLVMEPDERGAQSKDEELKAELLLEMMRRQADLYRSMHLLDERHELSVSLGWDVMEFLKRRDALITHDDGARQYVMLGSHRVWVEGDIWSGDDVKGRIDEVSEGVKRKAPTTGPRRNHFTKRGKNA